MADSQYIPAAPAGISRRRAVSQLAALGACLAGAACTPLRIVMHLYPEDFKSDPELVRRVLAGFADAVVPLEDWDHSGTAATYMDPRFPLGKYAPFLASDLTRRAYARGRREPFESLPRAVRTEIIQEALAAGGVTAQLYGGAIFLTQIVVYAGLCHDEGGCSAIGFDGPYQFKGLAATTYPNATDFLGSGIGVNGHPA
jgi:hypothetical protein